MRASNARIAGGFSGVLFAVIGGFSAAFAENANAQTATFQVFEPGPTALDINGISSDTSKVVSAFNLALTFPPNNSSNGVWAYLDLLIDGSADVPATEVPLSGGFPQFVVNGGTVQLLEIIGQTLRFSDKPMDSALISGDRFNFTVRVYFAEQAIFAFPSDSATASALTGEQFFLNTVDWTATTMQLTTNAGYAAPTCAEGMQESADGLMCVMTQTADSCARMTPPQVVVEGEGVCEDPQNNAECTLLDSTKPIFDENGGECVSADEMICRAMDPPQIVDPDGEGCVVPSAEICAMMTPPQVLNSDSDGCTEPPVAAGGGGDSFNENRIIGLGGAAIVGVLAWYLGDGTFDEFGFLPAFGYSVNENGYSANVGGRVNFRKDEWRLFWTAGQANANGAFGEFHYSSGGEYRADFWTASFSESVQGETADYDLSLSADLRGGMWSLSPVYRMNARFEEGESVSRNSLNLEGILEWNRWAIRQSAGFGWRRADEFGDNARFRLEAVREF